MRDNLNYLIPLHLGFERVWVPILVQSRHFPNLGGLTSANISFDIVVFFFFLSVTYIVLQLMQLHARN